MSQVTGTGLQIFTASSISYFLEESSPPRPLPFPNLPGVGGVKKLEITPKENINHGVEVRALENKAVPQSYMNNPRKPVSTQLPNEEKAAEDPFSPAKSLR